MYCIKQNQALLVKKVNLGLGIYFKLIYIGYEYAGVGNKLQTPS